MLHHLTQLMLDVQRLFAEAKSAVMETLAGEKHNGSGSSDNGGDNGVSGNGAGSASAGNGAQPEEQPAKTPVGP